MLHTIKRANFEDYKRTRDYACLPQDLKIYLEKVMTLPLKREKQKH